MSAVSRNKLTQIVFGVLAVGLVSLAVGLSAAENRADALVSHVDALTAPAMEGRGNRTEGLTEARDYIVEEMKRAGLQPGFDDTFLQPVDVVVDAEPSRDVTLRVADEVLAQGHQFSVAGFTGDGAFEAPVVFAGYGISAPHLGWDDYAELDVEGDVVVVLTGSPGPETLTLDSPTDRHLDTPQSKAAVALAHGARAALIVHDPDTFGDRADQRPDVLPEFWPAPALDGISVAFMTARASEQVLGPEFVSRRDALQKTPDKARGPLGVDASGNLTLLRDKRTLHNVVGRLPESPASGTPLVVGAHYDGLGMGEPGSLTDHTEKNQQLHPGADDNASGVAVMLEAADTLTEQGIETDRPVLFAALVSEELGLRGSRVLASELRYDGPPGSMINMDMVGRMKEQTLHAALPDDNSALASAVEQATAARGLSLKIESLRGRRSDHLSFAEAGFDAASLSTGRHVDYHMPTDTKDELDPDGMALVHDVIVDVVERLASAR
jgi:hypothetical protein